MLVRKNIFQLLLTLIENNDAAALKFFLKWEKDRRNYLHHRNTDGLTLLHHACLSGKRNVVQSLVDCGADIEAKSSVGWTALHAAALSGSYEVVLYLVSACASNVLAKDDMGCLAATLTLDPQITSFLKRKSEEIEMRNAEFVNFDTSMILQRRHTIAEKLSHRQAEIPRVRSTSNIAARKVRFQGLKEQSAETKSLPGDIESHLSTKDVLVPDEGLLVPDKAQNVGQSTKRDSGIYEDFDEKLSECVKEASDRNPSEIDINNNCVSIK